MIPGGPPHAVPPSLPLRALPPPSALRGSPPQGEDPVPPRPPLQPPSTPTPNCPTALATAVAPRRPFIPSQRRISPHVPIGTGATTRSRRHTVIPRSKRYTPQWAQSGPNHHQQRGLLERGTLQTPKGTVPQPVAGAVPPTARQAALGERPQKPGGGPGMTAKHLKLRLDLYQLGQFRHQLLRPALDGLGTRRRPAKPPRESKLPAVLHWDLGQTRPQSLAHQPKSGRRTLTATARGSSQGAKPGLGFRRRGPRSAGNAAPN